jgi:hypothetical protein
MTPDTARDTVRDRIADALREPVLREMWLIDEPDPEWAEHVADVLLSLPGIAIVDIDSLLERIDDAIEHALDHHYTLPDHECSCGATNNMDGDVLHAHRLGALSQAVAAVLMATANTAQQPYRDGL